MRESVMVDSSIGRSFVRSDQLRDRRLGIQLAHGCPTVMVGQCTTARCAKGCAAAAASGPCKACHRRVCCCGELPPNSLPVNNFNETTSTASTRRLVRSTFSVSHIRHQTSDTRHQHGRRHDSLILDTCFVAVTTDPDVTNHHHQ